MSGNKELGRLGEDTANKYLLRNGYTVLEKNFRTRFGEIDIIARDGKYLVFIEVKARNGTKYGYPREAVDKYKQVKIIHMAEIYILRKKLNDIPVRFDVVEVIVEKEDCIKSVEVIKNAFYQN
jgi:putative endonuclease